MIEDTRTPVSVHKVYHKGRWYVIKIFDEAAYHAAIARYYSDEERAAPARQVTTSERPRPARLPYERRKALSRYNWTHPTSKGA